MLCWCEKKITAFRETVMQMIRNHNSKRVSQSFSEKLNGRHDRPPPAARLRPYHPECARSRWKTWHPKRSYMSILITHGGSARKGQQHANMEASANQWNWQKNSQNFAVSEYSTHVFLLNQVLVNCFSLVILIHKVYIFQQLFLVHKVVSWWVLTNILFN